MTNVGKTTVKPYPFQALALISKWVCGELVVSSLLRSKFYFVEKLQITFVHC